MISLSSPNEQQKALYQLAESQGEYFATKQAAALAKNIVANWRAKQAAERARRPEAAQLELLQVAQSEA
jgi:hypothetical protein